MLDDNFKVIVIGGGISGLAAGYYLKKKNIPFQIIESQNRLGGVISSSQSQDFILEGGPNSYVLDDSMRIIIRDIGLWDDILVSNTNKKYILKKGKLYNLSPLFFLIGSFLSSQAKFKIFQEWFIAKKNLEDSDQSIGDFFQKYFGKEVFEYIIEPSLIGIYGKNVSRFSVKQTLPILFEWKAKGSIIRQFIKYIKKKGVRKVIAFRGGNESFIEKFSDFLGQDIIKKNYNVDRVISLSKGGFQISFSDAKIAPIQARHVISTLPYNQMRNILSGYKILKSIGNISYAPFLQLYLGYKKKHLSKKYDGFGFLNPKPEHKSFLGALWSSEMFSHRSSNRDHVLYTLFLSTDDCGNFDIEKSIDEFQEIMGIHHQPFFVEKKVWTRAFPEFDMNYEYILKKLDAFEKKNKGFYFSGNYRSGNSVRSCISFQKALVDRIKI